MNTQRGYSLLELAIVLVVLSLLMGGITAGFTHYMDRAEFIGAGRNHDLDELVAELKAVPDHAQGAGDGPGDPADVSTPEPDENASDPTPYWKRWLTWWRNTGRHDNRRSGR